MNLTQRREGAKRLGIAQAPQLPKTFCGHEGVLECSGWTELGMEVERVDGKIQSGVKPPQSKKEGCGISRGDAKMRRRERVGGSCSPFAASREGLKWVSEAGWGRGKKIPRSGAGALPFRWMSFPPDALGSRS
jgi:hypothetical protein